MYTHCPSCQRQFRVRASQLAAAEGLVQCGFCGKQFSALERLYDKPVIIEEIPSQEDSAEPDFIIPGIEDTDEDAAAAGERQDDNEGEDEDDIKIDLPGSDKGESADIGPRFQLAEDDDAPAGDTPAQADAVEAVIAQQGQEAVFPFPGALAEEAPVQSSRIARLCWALGVVILLVAGGAQLAWFQRDLLLNRYPQLLPYAKQLCQQLDCVLIRNRNISAIKLLNRDVRIHPRYEDALLVNATITNLSKYSQRFPTLLLSLFDTNGEVIAYRNIPASDYLDGSIDHEAGMPPNTPIHVVFEVAATETDAVSFEFDFL